jgi:sodium-dependent dicarboxylate transporter 2/3/5
MGPILALVVYALVPQTYVGPQGGLVELGAAGRGTAAVAAWMALWWLTEAVHPSVTAPWPQAAPS